MKMVVKTIATALLVVATTVLAASQQYSDGRPTATLRMNEQESKSLPWEREISLWEAAQSAKIQKPVNPTNPMPSWNKSNRFGNTMTITSLKMQTTLWGPSDRITVSLTKNNVWDRRY